MDFSQLSDEFAQAVGAFLDNLDPDEVAIWEPFFLHCSKAKMANPNLKWIKKATELVATLKKAELLNTVENLVSIVENELKVMLKAAYPDSQFLSDKSMNCLKGLLWATAPLENEHLTKKIESLAFTGYKKIRGHGAVSAKIGNACLLALATLPPEKAVKRLSIFKHKIKDRRTQKIIAKLVGKVADRAGIPAQELEEIAIDDYGLTIDRRLEAVVGKARGIVQLDETGKGVTMWRNKGKLQKTVPAEVKRNYPQALKDFKALVATVRSAIPMQKQRIENLYLEEREWDFDHWHKSYIQHPLVAIVARRLIWTFIKDGQKEEAIFHDGKFINSEKEVLAWIDRDTKIRLWHPIHAQPEVIFAWRNLLEELRIQQPFKQAYREVYLLTDAERDTENYSNRFAAHILKQNQFTSLCRVRDWRYGARGAWYSDNPNKNIPHWEIKAEFWVEVDWDGDQTNGGFFKYVFSDQVRFYKNDQQMRMDEVPALVFTEIMRDVDLFVGVASIGNDPNWQDGHNDRLDGYWVDYAFGDLSQTAKTRKVVLERLIPRLKIADRCSFDGKFLVVKGDIRSYKIHLGSGNILMLPNDQYLCIVPDAKKKAEQVFLPFEGDAMLSIILSKAFMLADDRAISDTTITSQIGE